ncbi:muscarinic acetylcholine receptor M1-like [Diadema setosum]|uniref:muscarinic acetylcholine receptor M1-like n=1 Tax=Diadema setosum TaxID=31175 RepID=UPI003B3AFCC8
MGVSVMGVVVITIDRYVATVHPMTHFTKKSRRLAVNINVLTWILPFTVWFLLNALWDILDPMDGVIGFGLPRPHYAASLPSSFMVFCLRFAGPFFIIMPLYLRVYYRIRSKVRKRLSLSRYISNANIDAKTKIRVQKTSKPAGNEVSVSVGKRCGVKSNSPEILDISSELSKLKTRNHKFPGEDRKPQTKSLSSNGRRLESGDVLAHIRRPDDEGDSGKSLKAMRTLSFIVLVFAVTWVPNVINIVLYSMSRCYDTVTTTALFNEISRWITYSNSLFNPVAYALAQPLIRQTVARMFCNGCRRNL